jgi:hypothetical protein
MQHGQPIIKIFSKHVEDNLMEIAYYEKCAHCWSFLSNRKSVGPGYEVGGEGSQVGVGGGGSKVGIRVGVGGGAGGNLVIAKCKTDHMPFSSLML